MGFLQTGVACCHGVVGNLTGGGGWGERSYFKVFLGLVLIISGQLSRSCSLYKCHFLTPSPIEP